MKDRYGTIKELRKAQTIAEGYIRLAQSLIERAKYDIELIQQKIKNLEKLENEES